MSAGAVGNRVRNLKCCTPAERFWAKVEKRGPEECWPWRGAVTSQHGYGNTAWDGHHLGAHKVAWITTNGPVPEGQCVLHKCDNRICCNPAHFFLGTRLDNNRDKVAKGRHIRGADAYNAKLTADDVREIRRLKGKVSGYELAKRYGVVQSYISQVQTRRTWTHIK